MIYEYYDIRMDTEIFNLTIESFREEYRNIESVERVVEFLGNELSLEGEEPRNREGFKEKIKSFFANIIKYIKRFFSFLIDRISLFIRSFTNYGKMLVRFEYPLTYIDFMKGKIDDPSKLKYDVRRFEERFKWYEDKSDRMKFKNYCQGLAEVLMVAGVYKETPSTFVGLLGLAKYGRAIVNRVLKSKEPKGNEIKESLISIRTVIEHYINSVEEESGSKKIDGTIKIFPVEGAPSNTDMEKFTFSIYKNYGPKKTYSDSTCVKCYDDYGLKKNSELSGVIKSIGKVIGTKMYKLTSETKKVLNDMNTMALKGLDGDIDNETVSILKECVKYENTLTRVYNLLIKGIGVFSSNVSYKIKKKKEPKMYTSVHEDRD